MEEDIALSVFAALSNKTRLRILKALVVAGQDGLNAGRIAELVGSSPSRASFHLSHMASSGLVTATRQAREIHYRVNFETIGTLVRYILQDCCGGNAQVRACCGVSET